MANAFKDKLWILDTASTTAVLQNVFDKLYVQKLIWQPGAGGQTLTIKDYEANVRLSCTSLAASPAGDIEFDFPKPLEVKGFILHTMTGGTLYVHL